jgi:hypothetical protein
LAGETPKEATLDIKDLVLGGTMVQEGEAFALINDKVYKAGDVVNGYTVLKVAAQQVEIEDNMTKLKHTLAITYKY